MINTKSGQDNMFRVIFAERIRSHASKEMYSVQFVNNLLVPSVLPLF